MPWSTSFAPLMPWPRSPRSTGPTSRSTSRSRSSAWRTRSPSSGRATPGTDGPIRPGHDEAGADGAGFVVWGSRDRRPSRCRLSRPSGRGRPCGPLRLPPLPIRPHARPWPPPACPRHRGRSRTRRRRGCRTPSGVAAFAASETNQPWFCGAFARPPVGCRFLLVGFGDALVHVLVFVALRARLAPRVGPAPSCRPPRMRVSVHPRQQPAALRPKPDGLRAPHRSSGRARRGRPAGRGGGE